MSYSYRGRYTHSYEEYQRWQREDQADQLRASNTELSNRADRIRSELSQTQQQLENARGDVRRMSALHTQLERQQQQLRTVVEQVQRGQEQFRRQAEEQHRRALAEVAASERRTTERIDTLEAETEAHIRQVEQEVTSVQAAMVQGFAEVRTEIQRSEERLQQEVDGVKQQLEAERQRRVRIQAAMEDEARVMARFVDEELRQLTHVEGLELGPWVTEARQQLRLTETVLQGPSPEQAANHARNAFSALQTAVTEREKRLGCIDGVAAYLETLATDLEQLVSSADFLTLFTREAEIARMAADRLRSRAAAWREEPHWISFQNEHRRLLEVAEELRCNLIAMSARVGGLMGRLNERERKLQTAAQRILTARGAPDRWEVDFADPGDPKSDRILRACFGQAVVAWYEALDGTWRLDAYGFDSAGECNRRSSQMQEIITADSGLYLVEGQTDPGNRQAPAGAAGTSQVSWEAEAAAIARGSRKLEEV